MGSNNVPFRVLRRLELAKPALPIIEMFQGLSKRAKPPLTLPVTACEHIPGICPSAHHHLPLNDQLMIIRVHMRHHLLIEMEVSLWPSPPNDGAHGTAPGPIPPRFGPNYPVLPWHDCLHPIKQTDEVSHRFAIRDRIADSWILPRGAAGHSPSSRWRTTSVPFSESRLQKGHSIRM